MVLLNYLARHWAAAPYILSASHALPHLLVDVYLVVDPPVVGVVHAAPQLALDIRVLQHGNPGMNLADGLSIYVMNVQEDLSIFI